MIPTVGVPQVRDDLKDFAKAFGPDAARAMSEYQQTIADTLGDSRKYKDDLAAKIRAIHARRAKLENALHLTTPFQDQSRTKAWLEDEKDRVGGLLQRGGDPELQRLYLDIQKRQQAAIALQATAEAEAAAAAEEKRRRVAEDAYDPIVEVPPEEVMTPQPHRSHEELGRRYASYARYAPKYDVYERTYGAQRGWETQPGQSQGYPYSSSAPVVPLPAPVPDTQGQVNSAQFSTRL